MALDPGEAVRNLPYLAAGGWLVVNAPDLSFLSPKGTKALASFGARVVCAPASELARSVGAAKGANVVLLGAAAAAGALPLSPAELERAITEGQPEARARANRELLALGAGAASPGLSAPGPARAKPPGKALFKRLYHAARAC